MRAELPIVLGLDPSLSCTGWALIEMDESLDGRFIAAGSIVPSRSGSLVYRILDLAKAVRKRVRERIPDLVVIETPAETGRAKSGQTFAGTALTIPVYGAAVGACIVACDGIHDECLVIGTASDEWTRARDTPRCSRDKDKVNRVEYVREVWRLGDLGPKTLAGNVADALLIARWGVRHYREHKA